MSVRPTLHAPQFGSGPLDACLVNWKGWIEYAVNLIGGKNCKVRRTAAGNVIDVEIPPTWELAKVTTAAPASGLSQAYTTGVATLLADGGSSPLVVPAVAISVAFKNDHDVKCDVGATVKLLRHKSGSYWVTDIDSCTHTV